MKSSANAVGGKTARACDSCVKRRARWYCPSDDAFLCQACDGSVHSANPLARRHERVRLKSASSSRTHRPTTVSPPGTAKWHHGFTRKARTPRGSGSAGKPNQRAVFFHDLVPEISVEDQTENYEEEQLIFQVPVLDPTVSEQYRDDAIEEKTGFPLPELIKFADMNEENDEDNAESCLDRFFPTDMELAEFAADVDTLLGHNLETESFATEDLGLGDGLSVCGRSSSMMLKLENEDVHEEETVAREGTPMELFYERKGMPFELSFDQDHSHRAFEEEEEDEEKNVINVNTGERESVRSGGSSNISHSIKKK
ncbi:PREDICTED: zinc finger protein CONSTANS-LIKE 16-like [Tarenaya hassleriana]|uniref:zinc finger protein CONSTANS-LIKE 16-like n=2 Tax=Tarenaya hassleriana TaxID=28532 RepID=UPI00053C4711|nr:PREDICTED: zinc finger protein CONSTANS-LIKE 16-like [Tarenaya hassleriana]